MCVGSGWGVLCKEESHIVMQAYLVGCQGSAAQKVRGTATATAKAEAVTS